MTAVRTVQGLAAAGVVALLAWGVSAALERLFAPPASPPPVAADGPDAATAHIEATLYYGAEDGGALVAVRREVPLATGIVGQAREILTVQLQPAPEPYLTLVPPGTALRGFYLTDRGDAFVDLTGEVSRGHPGGSFAELLTVYAIVNAVTTNLPAIQRVQILIDGREADTLAGHVDLRRPLAGDTALVRQQAEADAAGAEDPGGELRPDQVER